MITSFLLDCNHPLWWAINAVEFGVFLLFVRPEPSRRSWGWSAATAVAGLAAWETVGLLHLDFLFDFCLNTLVAAVYLGVARCSNAVQGIYVASLFCLCTEIGKIVCVDLCMQPFYNVLSGLAPVGVTVLWAVLSIGIAGACLAVVSRWTFRKGLARLTWKQMAAVLLPLVPYMCVRVNEQLFFELGNGRLYGSMVALALTLALSTIAVIITNAYNLSSQIERNDVLRMEGLLREQRVQFAEHEKAEHIVRRQYHDLKNFVSAVEALCRSTNDGDALKGIAARLGESITAYGACVETENDVLDVILAGKRGACAEKGIELLFYADAACLSFMDSLDVCALFGNLLDNAIEAVERLPVEGRFIEFDVRPRGGFAVAKVVNPFDGILPEKGRSTIKPDARRHGIGLLNARAAVEKYGGALSTAAEDGVFTATAVIPLQSAPASTGYADA